MSIVTLITPKVLAAIETTFNVAVEKLEFQQTKKEFEGDITLVVFPLLKIIKGNPVEIGTKINIYP